jgi:hypothetical protein
MMKIHRSRARDIANRAFDIGVHRVGSQHKHQQSKAAQPQEEQAAIPEHQAQT